MFLLTRQALSSRPEVEDVHNLLNAHSAVAVRIIN